MPIYSFRNKDTGEVEDKLMSYDLKLKYLEENPNVESIITGAPSIGDSYRLGITKASNGWRETLSKIHETTPGSRLNETSSVQF